MIETVRLDRVIFDTEPWLHVIGSPMHLGYSEYVAGRPDRCREIIAAFLVSVYASRAREKSTEAFVREICRERNVRFPQNREETDPAIVYEAALRRYDVCHLPLVERIVKSGYFPLTGTPVTMIRNNGSYFVGDGKNRCSILAALGREEIENVRVME